MRNALEVPVVLLNGCWRNGACHREVRVRAVAEDDECLVDDLSAAPRPFERDTQLLERCVLGLERAQDVNVLSVGDREALLFHARRLTFGAEIECVLPCPQCGERMDFRLQIDRLLAQQDPADFLEEIPALFFEEVMQAGGQRFRVRFRLPCGADLTAGLNPPMQEPAEAVRVVLERCVEWARPEPELEGSPAIPQDKWPPELAARISERMAELDPQAETALSLICPACRHAFTSWFDIGDYFSCELRAREHRRLQEVHQLALAYHWSETEILNMSPRKRQLYLNMLAESLGD